MNSLRSWLVVVWRITFISLVISILCLGLGVAGSGGRLAWAFLRVPNAIMMWSGAFLSLSAFVLFVLGLLVRLRGDIGGAGSGWAIALGLPLSVLGVALTFLAGLASGSSAIHG
jgi:hypothetical protein